MKRLLSFLVSFLLLIINLSLFTACNGGEDGAPQYSETYSFNENLHWKNQINGSGRTDVGEHVNDRGKCELCDYYYDSSEYISYVKVKYNNQIYYSAYEYKGRDSNAYVNIEIPAYYQGEGDQEPIPVIAIYKSMFRPKTHQGIESIRSIKLNEGIKFLGRSAFNGTSIKEIIIPNSVTNGFNAINNLSFDEEGNQIGVATLGGTDEFLYNLFSETPVKRAIIGNGVKGFQGYVFSSCSELEEVVIGNSLTRLATRDFYQCSSLKTVIIPASLTSISESHIYDPSVNKVVSLHNIFEQSKGYPDIFMYMSKERYNELKIKQVPRDVSTGYPLDEDGKPVESGFAYPSYGIVEGWCGIADVYFKGEWHFDENGKPMPN